MTEFIHAGVFRVVAKPAFVGEFEKNQGVRRERNLYVGAGLNLSELLFRNRNDNSRLEGTSRWVLEHVQVPYTYVSTSNID